MEVLEFLEGSPRNDRWRLAGTILWNFDSGDLACCGAGNSARSAVGRWGNWFNQELFGRPTTLPWALRIDDDHLPAAYESGTTFHPTFLYESMWTLGLSLWLVRLSGSPRFAGSRLFALYVSGYGLGRLWIEGLRIDDASVIGGLRWNQWVAIAAIVGGLIYLAVTSSSGDSAEEVDVQQAAINGDR